jgi:hypothetical protein
MLAYGNRLAKCVTRVPSAQDDGRGESGSEEEGEKGARYPGQEPNEENKRGVQEEAQQEEDEGAVHATAA